MYSKKSPDDGQRNCPKHVEFYSKNKFEKLVHMVGFIIIQFYIILAFVVPPCKLIVEHFLGCRSVSQLLLPLPRQIERHRPPVVDTA